MRCSASPTTFSAAPEPALSAAPNPHSAAAGDETTIFTTMLLDIALKPISETVGVLGSAVTDAVAAHIARSAFE